MKSSNFLLPRKDGQNVPELGIEKRWCARFGSTYTKIGTIQRRLAWPLRKDDTQIREAFHIKKKKKKRGGDGRTRKCYFEYKFYRV